MCVRKKRWADKGSIGSKLGFRVFQQFYKQATSAKKDKTFDEFIRSQYYTDFVKFGKYLVDLNPVDAEKFIDYVIRNGVKLSFWTKDRTYDTFLKEYMQKELVGKALERTITEMMKWAEANDSHYSKFFQECDPNEAAWLLRGGRISPWAFFLADTSKDLMRRMNADHERLVASVMDDKFWQKKLTSNKEDTLFAIEILNKANL